MDTTPEQKNIPEAPKVEAPKTAPVAVAPVPPRDSRDAHARGGDGRRRNTRKPGDRGGRERVKPEFDSKIISIRRVTRVAAGGRRFSFSVAVVAGNRKGSVGVGIGKAGDTSLAIDKATRDAKKHMIKVATTKNMSILHPVRAKYSSARIEIRPAPGRGVVAGSAARNVIEFAGLKDIMAKIISPSKNKLNIARGTVAALKTLGAFKPGQKEVESL
ncbi:MAG TPA: 30S ribosomal protein S5 [Candidatus Paceibacterota bacterium]